MIPNELIPLDPRNKMNIISKLFYACNIIFKNCVCLKGEDTAKWDERTNNWNGDNRQNFVIMFKNGEDGIIF